LFLFFEEKKAIGVGTSELGNFFVICVQRGLGRGRGNLMSALHGAMLNEKRRKEEKKKKKKREMRENLNFYSSFAGTELPPLLLVVVLEPLLEGPWFFLRFLAKDKLRAVRGSSFSMR